MQQEINYSTRRVAIVTGASSGIGAQVSAALVQLGWEVAGFSRRECQVEHVHSFKVDVKDWQALKKAVEGVKNTLGSPEIVVHCAGEVLPELLVNATKHNWTCTLETHLGGALGLVKSTWRLMVANRKGRYVFVGSQVGKFGGVGIGSYAAAKAALKGIAACVNSEAAGAKRPEIRAVVVDLPIVDTPMTRRFTEKHLSNLQKVAPAISIQMAVEMILAAALDSSNSNTGL